MIGDRETLGNVYPYHTQVRHCPLPKIIVPTTKSQPLYQKIIVSENIFLLLSLFEQGIGVLVYGNCFDGCK